jgi:hypothetical protein
MLEKHVGFLSVHHDLQISTSSVEVEIQVLSTNGHLAEILDILWGGASCDRAILAFPQDRIRMGGLQAILGICFEHGCRAVAVELVIVNGWNAVYLRTA